MRDLRSELEAVEDALIAIEQEMAAAYEEREKELDMFDEEVMGCLRDQVEVWGDVPMTAHDIDRDADPLVVQLRRDKESAQADANAKIENLKAAAEAADQRAQEAAQQAAATKTKL